RFIVRASALLAVATLAFVASASARQDKAGSQKAAAPVTLNAFMFTSLKLGWDAVVANYEKAFPNVTINTTYYVDSVAYNSALVAQIAAGGGPDVFSTTAGYFSANSILNLAPLGRLTPLSGPWIKRTDKRLLAGTELGGRWYGYPLDVVYGG